MQPENYKPGREPGRAFSGQELLILSVLSFFIYLMAALLIIHYFHDDGLFRVFEHGFSITGQLFTGTVAGSLAAALIRFISTRRPVSGVLDDFYIYRTISSLRLSRFDRIQLSLFAGTGEELLFRGAIQPVLGIWFTSFIFVAMHGYVSFKSRGHLLFTAMMFALSMLLGYLFIYAGLIAAMIAHAVYDAIMLNSVKADRQEN